jgi:hypothetical protein
LIILSFSCNKEEDVIDDPKDDPKDEVLTPVFEMEIDGIKWKARDFQYKHENGLHVVLGSDPNYSVRWDIENITLAKAYVLGKNENKLISSFYNYIDNKPQSFVVESGELIIEEFDTEKKIMKAKFSFDASYKEKILKVTNGKFIIKDF